tara:strand:+ start:61 stop:780 length:720 start_codon:yes stop_codon:yes gene_type:complete
MANYFEYFPKVFYNFGNEKTSDVFQDITVYADIIDQVKDAKSLYTDYYVQEGERPDQVSLKLYGSSTYHWTFFFLNNKLREQGWPLSNNEARNYAIRKYPNDVITTRTALTSLTGFFKTGDIVTGRTSGVSSVILHRNLDLGQIVVKGNFLPAESIETSGTTDLVTVQSVSKQFNSAHHYENTSGVVDIDPTIGPGILLTEVTYMDRVISQNNNLKQIRVFKPSSINEIVRSFRETVSV